MNLLEVIAALYDSEINCGMASFWDAGFEVWLGDEVNGKRAIRSFYPDKFDEAGKWLHEAALEYHPESEYARGGSGEKTNRKKGRERKVYPPEDPR